MKTVFKPYKVSLTPLATALLIAYSGWTSAQPAEVIMPRVDVIGDAENLPNIAGAGHILDKDELEASHVFTVNEALRKVPGVNARDEEGFGLRPNIGIRGLNPTRSAKITLLEDGIPLAYAPYGDNASYYHPQVDRYDRIEVLKGAGSMLYGPQTIGGVINYITPTPPQRFGGYVQGVVGNRDYFNGKINVGGKGLLFDYSRKQGDGARDNMEHQLDDLNLKYVTPLGSNQALTLRANYYTEDSTITYSGLTQAEFDRLGARYNPFKNDKFDIKRTGVSATHEVDFGKGALLLTNLYYSRFDRDWWRQASNSQDSQCGGAFNASRLAGTVVNADTCNSIQGRLRSYTTWGIEPRLTIAHKMGEFQAGIKAHFEEQNRKQVNGTSPTARNGTLVEDNQRNTDAWSAYMSNRFDIGQFGITPIVRYEYIDSKRTNKQTGVTGSSTVTATMPGIGVTWNPNKQLTVFSSLHKGFAPQRVEDLIGSTGTVTDVDAEESINFELGLRSQLTPWASVQAAYFRNDYDNLIAVGSIAGGSTPLSQGKALFEGLELSAKAEMKNGFFGRLAYTWLPTADQTTAYRRVDTQTTVAGSAPGLRQPYAPEHMLTTAVGYATGPVRAEVEAQYVSKQYSDFANTSAPAANGQTGIIDGYTIWNASLNYQFHPKGATVFLTGKNLVDKTYIVDRTRGIQVGMPRLVQVGLKVPF